MTRIKSYLVVLLLLSISIQNVYSQKDNSAAAGIAGAAIGLGLGILAAKLAINEIEDQQEALMLEWLIENNQVHIPSGFELGTVNWNFNSTTDIYRANVLAFYLRKIDTSFVYLKLVGNEKYFNKHGTNYVLGSVLKYNKKQWEDLMLNVLRAMDPTNFNFYKSADSIYVRSDYEEEGKWLKLKNIITYNRTSRKLKFMLNPFDPFSEEVHTKIYRKDDDHHDLFNLSSGCLHNEKLIGDWSENELSIYIPSIQQSIMLTIKDLVNIYRTFP